MPFKNPTRETLTRFREQMKRLPPMFGLKGMQGWRFRLVEGTSYRVTDKGQLVVLLARADRDGKWRTFAHATLDEVLAGLDMSEIEQDRKLAQEVPLQWTGRYATMPQVKFEIDPRSFLIGDVERTGERRYRIMTDEFGSLRLTMKEIKEAFSERVPQTFPNMVMIDLLTDYGNIDYKKLSRVVGRSLKGKTIPKDLQGIWKTPHGIQVLVNPATGAYAEHRVFLKCDCGKWIPLGRFVQHRGSSIHRDIVRVE